MANELKSQASVITMTLEITRATTGIKETVDVVFTPITEIDNLKGETECQQVTQ